MEGDVQGGGSEISVVSGGQPEPRVPNPAQRAPQPGLLCSAPSDLTTALLLRGRAARLVGTSTWHRPAAPEGNEELKPEGPRKRAGQLVTFAALESAPFGLREATPRLRPETRGKRDRPARRLHVPPLLRRPTLLPTLVLPQFLGVGGTLPPDMTPASEAPSWTTLSP